MCKRPVSVEQRLRACSHYVTRCSCDLWNIASALSHRSRKKNKGRVKYLLSLLSSLNCNCANCLDGLSSVGDLFIGDTSVEMCGRSASSWHEWVANAAGDVVLAALNAFDIPYHFTANDAIEVVISPPPPSPSEGDFPRLRDAIAHAGHQDCRPLNTAELSKLDGHLSAELVNALRRDGESAQHDVQATDIPQWDKERRELSFSGHVVKRYRQPAKNQIPILEAFQIEGWPARIDDPLPFAKDGDSRQRLADAVLSLNKNDTIQFELDGTRAGILWKLKPR